MDKIIFLVQGSSPDPYEVSFHKKNDQILAFCTCNAGSLGKYCKHRSDILFGSTVSIVSENSNLIKNVQEWFKGSILESVYVQLKDAEENVVEAKKAEKAIRAKISSVMHGRYQSS